MNIQELTALVNEYITHPIVLHNIAGTTNLYTDGDGLITASIDKCGIEISIGDSVNSIILFDDDELIFRLKYLKNKIIKDLLLHKNEFNAKILDLLIAGKFELIRLANVVNEHSIFADDKILIDSMSSFLSNSGGSYLISDNSSGEKIYELYYNAEYVCNFKTSDCIDNAHKIIDDGLVKLANKNIESLLSRIDSWGLIKSAALNRQN